MRFLVPACLRSSAHANSHCNYTLPVGQEKATRRPPGVYLKSMGSAVQLPSISGAEEELAKGNK
ncbi:hypothetical protein E2C01_026457 [Portunus trituberculatus]|uniref:Uncharacterized protein n=1 Tax=Portunus trituberculatus TaxID=210409 RepID=A0A5B7EL01_PORTR|nr:hypothetical protein [Portunus trituberculatus]